MIFFIKKNKNLIPFPNINGKVERLDKRKGKRCAPLSRCGTSALKNLPVETGLRPVSTKQIMQTIPPGIVLL